MENVKEDIKHVILNGLDDDSELIECVYVVLTESKATGQMLVIGSTNEVQNTVRTAMLEKAAEVFGANDAHS